MTPTSLTTPQTQLQTLELSETYGKFVLAPLERGYGQTIGNSLRRILLAGVPGAAVTAVRVEGVLHEFAPIPGVKEDMNELLLNIRDLAIRVNRERPPEEDFELLVDVKKKGRVTGADVQCPSDVEIVNPECYLCTISESNKSLYIEMYVSWGTGYVLPERHEKYKGKIGIIPVGSNFTPVKKANYTVEATRVGQRTDYERLTLEVWTNGAVQPNVALCQASEILNKYLRMFSDIAPGSMKLGLLDEGEATPELAGVPDVRIEELDFTQRTYNCLRKAHIETLKDIMQYTESELLAIRGFGKKALDEVREKLAERGIKLRPGKAHLEALAEEEEEDYEE